MSSKRTSHEISGAVSVSRSARPRASLGTTAAVKHVSSCAAPQGTTSDGLPVYCAFTRIERVADLKPDPDNWNEHPPEQLEMAAEIFARGIRRPIRVSARSGLITAGHGALQTALYKGWTDWPIEVQHYATRADEIADLTADNQLGKKARTNEQKLTAMLQQITGEMDIKLAGVDDAEFAGLLSRMEEDTQQLVPVAVKPAPETAWVLVGIPVARWKEIAAQVEAISKVPGIEYHTGTGTAKPNIDEEG